MLEKSLLIVVMLKQGLLDVGDEELGASSKVT
jgi:hypothetical protein